MRHRLTIALAGLVLASGVALGQAHLGLHVVDANGQRVGYVFDCCSAVIFINGQAFSAYFSVATGFVPYTVYLFYESTDCSGAGYLELISTLVQRAYYTTDGVIRYPSSSLGQLVTTNSSQIVDENGNVHPCSTGPNSITGATVLTVPAPTYTLPFSVVDALQVSPAPPVPTFNDVPTTHPFFQFIEALYNSGITGGCSASPPLYCPDTPVTRGQMAVFLAKALGL